MNSALFMDCIDEEIRNIVSPPKYTWQKFILKRKYKDYPEVSIDWYKKNPYRIIPLIEILPKVYYPPHLCKIQDIA